MQLTWPALPAPRVTIELGDVTAVVQAGREPVIHVARRAPRTLSVSGGFGGPGSLVVDGLQPQTTYRVALSGAGLPPGYGIDVTTLATPPGALLLRIATLNDIHIGEGAFGVFGTIEDPFPLPDGTEPHPLRAARAALHEALAWGAEAIVVKGDLSRSSADAEFHEVGKLLATSPVPVMAVLGNHDVKRGTDAAATLATHGITVATEPAGHDLPGLRVVLGHSPSPTTKWGIVDAEQRRRVVELAGAAPRGALVVFHHQPHGGLASRCYPPGIDQATATKLLDAVADANPATLVTSGHTHRHRARRHGPLVVTETGSPKDYPGTWTGYAVSEGGIRQVTRRVSAPAVMGWTEVTGQAMGGIWRWWSPGSLAQRCFTHRWPLRAG